MITPVEIAVALGRSQPQVDTPELAQWQMWIDSARFLIRNRLGDLDLLDAEALDYVVREAVVAKIRRPDDATQVDISVDDGRVSKIYQSSTGTVFIRPEWWAMLSPSQEGSQAFSTRPGFAPDRCLW